MHKRSLRCSTFSLLPITLKSCKSPIFVMCDYRKWGWALFTTNTVGIRWNEVTIYRSMTNIEIYHDFLNANRWRFWLKKKPKPKATKDQKKAKMGGGDGLGHRGWNWHWVQPPKSYQTMIVPVNSLFNYEYWKLYWTQVIVARLRLYLWTQSSPL